MPVVSDFFTTLKSKAAPAARWHKVDLHNHSPASYDFGGNRDTAVADFAQKIRDERLSVVMFTDHEKLPESAFVQAVAKESGALILSGLEVNVFVDAFGKPADKVGKEICFHLLVGFDPDTHPSPQYWVDHLYLACRTEERDFGGTILKGVVASMDQIHGVLEKSGAFLIPAHLHTRKDAFRSRSIDDVVSEAEFLRWTRAFFTALDVRKDSTAAYFDGKHAETGNIEKVCIRSSDAHDASQLGTCPTWVQMERVSFAELKAALELPNRVCRSQPEEPSSYVVGLHVQGHYLPDQWMMLSPHLNVLIGVKGAGKTSILECLRFGLGNEVPHDRQEEVNKHLTAILGSTGRVRLLLRRDDGGRVLVERSVANKKFKVTFEDDQEVVFDTAEPIRFSSVVLGWHEIEHAATDRQIRRLQMDAIAGREDVFTLTQQAKALALAIQQKHDVAATKYSQFLQLSDTVARQEQMRQGLQQLKEANLIEMRDQMSNALAARTEIQRFRDHLSTIPQQVATRLATVMQLDQFKLEGLPPLADVVKAVNSDIAELRHLSDEFGAQAVLLSQRKLETVNANLQAAQAQFETFSDNYRARLAALPPEVQRLLESHRDVLEKTRDLPNLKARLDELTTEIDAALAELADTSERVAKCLDDRFVLREEKVRAFGQLLLDAGVTLEVVSGIARDDEFSSTFNQFSPSRDVYSQLRANRTGVKRFHRTLAEWYAALRQDLKSGDRVMFSRAEASYLVTVLENDDLQIRFAVGKPGEQFSPIDQLSAGQRCTAVFPILLKLKDGPLVLDQPEDNLDNRHIAASVAPVLISDKRTRQIVLTSHNANLVVLSDPESISVFEAVDGKGSLAVGGFLSHRGSTVTRHVLDTLDGGERALELRTRKYGRLS